MRLLLLFALIISTRAFAQNLDEKLFHSICEELHKKDKHLKVKEKLKGVILTTDPVNGTDKVVYRRDSTSSELNEFRSYSKQDQIDILMSSPSAVTPLADTTFIVDSINFFSGISFYKIENHCFQLVEHLDKNQLKRGRPLFLYGSAIRGNTLMIAFFIPDKKKSFRESFTCEFELDKCPVRLLKSRIADNRFME